MPTSGLDQLLLSFACGIISCTPLSYTSACLAFLTKGQVTLQVHIHRLYTQGSLHSQTDPWGKYIVEAQLLRVMQAWPLTLM